MPQAVVLRAVRRALAVPLLAASVAALTVAVPVRASDAQAAPGEPVKSARTAPKAATPTDPMEALREKLASKLGAMKAPDASTPHVLSVVARSGPSASGTASADGAGHRAGNVAAGSGRPGGTSATVARLRAAKAAVGQLPDGPAAQWGYGGAGGPAQWGQLKPEFSTCARGTRQSPIELDGGVKVDLEPIRFDYQPSAFSVIDTGHTIQVNVAGANAIEVQGRRFDLVQFHFHRPSEERINGRQFDMVVHLVHQDAEGRLAVVAVLLDRGSAQPLVQTIWNHLPLERHVALGVRADIDVGQLLPADRRYYTYMGSLTTPPCSEGVLWLVLQQPVPIAEQQIGVFSHLYPMNARPLQQAAGRLIKQSN